ncbi:MAG TPA: ion channel [Bacteroidales bacterium]|jgi:hypothetical protein|nr:ion channel [Bacteroidales bacterium]|tara:strand:+ start:2700 stop:3356 length:657 start_codon:yes stop_codon:yes gene_type:complete
MIHHNKLTFGVDKTIFLLMSIVAFVFIFPIIDNEVIHDLFITISYTLVLLSIFSIVGSMTKLLSYLVVLAVVANFLLLFFADRLLGVISFLISTLTFTIATGVLIKHIAISKNVTVAVVIQAISGYLLIGIIGVLLNSILLAFDENAITLTISGSKFSSIIYYSFITLTTIGYGEIVPQSVFARSISIFIGVCGQMYLTVIIALIVGKYLSLNLRKKS